MRDVSLRLSRRIALVGERLGRLILSPAPGGPLEPAPRFLQLMLDATSDAPAGGAVDPIDRVAGGLTPLEIDLLLLAAMPEDHEGYASLLRAVHPRSEPYATAGLAAQLFCPTLVERTRLRETLDCGAAIRLGLITLTGDAPFYERTLTLGESLWPALCGLDTCPAS